MLGTWRGTRCGPAGARRAPVRSGRGATATDTMRVSKSAVWLALSCLFVTTSVSHRAYSLLRSLGDIYHWDHLAMARRLYELVTDTPYAGVTASAQGESAGALTYGGRVNAHWSYRRDWSRGD
jgi:hypothetical protein